MAGLTVIDASVLIAYFTPGDAHNDAAVELLEAADSLAASTITIAEILVGAVRGGRVAQRLAALTDIELSEIPIGQGDARVLAELRAETKLRMPDCCVLHAAMVSGADSIATFDEALRKAVAGRWPVEPPAMK